MDTLLVIAFSVIALALVVKTVFYCIEVCINARATKKSLKLVNKLIKKYEPLFDKMSDMLDNTDL